jgi:flagellar protein FliS
MANPARAYLATQVETTTQGELLIMLYEAAIKFLKRAKIEIDNKDYAKKGIYISKAMAIIHELAESLNKEKGGEITPKLNQLYMFCTSQLIKANIRLDKKMVDDVIKILDGLRSAYAHIVAGGETAGAEGRPGTPGPLPKVPQAPQAPPMHPAAYTLPKSGQPEASAPQTPKQQQPTPPESPTPPADKTAVTDKAAGDQMAATPQPPQPPTPPQPPKLRSAFNAAKFRAANAYNNNNR